MPHSLSAKLSGLRHKQYITEDEYKRLREALRIQREIEVIKAEIRQKQWHINVDSANQVIEIINKHIGGQNDQG